MSFVIIKVDPLNKTMVIDWGQTTLNHKIPAQILNNPNLTADESAQIIEQMRPKKLEPIEIPQGLQALINIADTDLSAQGSVDNEVIL